MRYAILSLVLGVLVLSAGTSRAEPFTDAFDDLLEKIAWKKGELERLQEPGDLKAAKALGKLQKKAAKKHDDLGDDVKLARAMVKTFEKYFDDEIMIPALDRMLNDLGTEVREYWVYLELWYNSVPPGKAREKAKKLLDQGEAYLVQFEEKKDRPLRLKFLKKAVAKFAAAEKKLRKLGDPPEPPSSRDPVLVYRADQVTDNVIELWRTEATTGNYFRLNGFLASGGNVVSFKVSPDGNLVAYRADQDTDNVFELYVSKLQGLGNWKVSGNLVSGGGVMNYHWSPDSTMIAYGADQETNNVNEVFVATADGSGDVKVSGNLPGGGYGASLPADINPWAPDNSRIAYHISQVASELTELYTSLPDGTDKQRVTAGLIANSRSVLVWLWGWAPDSSWIAYVADQDTDNVFELYAGRPGGGSTTRMSGAMPTTARVDRFAWAPDSSRIAYLADQDTDNVTELYTSQKGGSGNTKVSGTLPGGGNVDPVAIRWAPDSSRIAYRADQDQDNVTELYTAPAGGGATAKVNGPLPGGGMVHTAFFWASDSSRITYLAEGDLDNVKEIYVGRADGSGSVRVSGALPGGGNCALGDRSDEVWSMDSRLSYVADQDTDNIVEFFTVNPDAAGNEKVSGTLVPGGNVYEFGAWSPSEEFFRIAYLADQDTDNIRELYTSKGGGGDNRRVSGPMVAGGNVIDFAWAK